MKVLCGVLELARRARETHGVGSRGVASNKVLASMAGHERIAFLVAVDHNPIACKTAGARVGAWLKRPIGADDAGVSVAVGARGACCRAI